MLDLPAIYAEHAPQVHPTTMAAIVRAESGGDPLAIGVNGPGGGRRRARDLEDAVRIATALIAAGRSVDLGLAQISWNAGHLQRRGLSVRDAFDPRVSVRVGAEVLVANYAACRRNEPQACLVEALSRYNTGDRERGVRNGYVAKVMGGAGAVAATVARATASVLPARPAPPGPPPAWGGIADRAWAEAVSAAPSGWIARQ